MTKKEKFAVVFLWAFAFCYSIFSLWRFGDIAFAVAEGQIPLTLFVLERMLLDLILGIMVWVVYFSDPHAETKKEKE